VQSNAEPAKNGKAAENLPGSRNLAHQDAVPDFNVLFISG
jgi:hypothetical protein